MCKNYTENFTSSISFPWHNYLEFFLWLHKISCVLIADIESSLLRIYSVFYKLIWYYNFLIFLETHLAERF